MSAKAEDKRQKTKGKSGSRVQPRGDKGFRSLLTLVFCLLPFVFCLVSCSSVKTTTRTHLGSGHYPPTDPAQVEVLHRPPMRPYVRLGNVRATPQGGADEQQIEAALRTAAANLGANAIIVPMDAEPGSVVEATAIAYK